MKEELIKLLDKAYAPYSNFHVACLIEMNDGKFIPGVNVENASYGLCNCAERSAIFSAVSNGYKRHDFDKLYVMCDTKKLGTPCFACRQVINEMFEREKEVICITNQGVERVFKVSELCPYPFDDESMN